MIFKLNKIFNHQIQNIMNNKKRIVYILVILLAGTLVYFLFGTEHEDVKTVLLGALTIVIGGFILQLLFGKEKHQGKAMK